MRQNDEWQNTQKGARAARRDGERRDDSLGGRGDRASRRPGDPAPPRGERAQYPGGSGDPRPRPGGARGMAGAADRVRGSVRDRGGGQRHPLDRDRRAVGTGRLRAHCPRLPRAEPSLTGAPRQHHGRRPPERQRPGPPRPAADHRDRRWSDLPARDRPALWVHPLRDGLLGVCRAVHPLPGVDGRGAPRRGDRRPHPGPPAPRVRLARTDGGVQPPRRRAAGGSEAAVRGSRVCKRRHRPPDGKRDRRGALPCEGTRRNTDCSGSEGAARDCRTDLRRSGRSGRAPVGKPRAGGTVIQES